MQDFPEVSWMERYRERINADPEMGVIGGWFSTSLSLSFGCIRLRPCASCWLPHGGRSPGDLSLAQTRASPLCSA